MLTRTVTFKGTWIRIGILVVMVSVAFILKGAPTVWSVECYSASPSFGDDRSPYGAINVRNLTQSEHQALSTLFKSLKGRWNGDGDGLRCRGSAGSYTTERLRYSIQAEGITDYHGSVRLKIKLHSMTERTNQTEIIAFYLVDKKLRFNDDASAGDVELIDAANDRVSLLQRKRGGPGTIHREIFISVIATRRAFSIERKIYSQGQFTFGSTLHFRR